MVVAAGGDQMHRHWSKTGRLPEIQESANDAGCCGLITGIEPEPSRIEPEASRLPRRTFLGWAARLGLSALGLSLLGRSAGGQARRRVRLAFCSQLLCIVPYEAARQQSYFAEEGLDVELVYMRGGTAAMQALVGGAVDYAATSFDVALGAFARGAEVVRFFTTGRLPLFALATAPATAERLRTLVHLRGRTVGVSALGNADHLLLVYLLKRGGVDPARVSIAVLGPNLFEALRAGHVDAGMVQEPAVTLTEQAGGRILVNLMDLAQARRYLGGPYEFMGVTARRADLETRRDEMRALARGLSRGLRFIQYGTPRLLADALPKELIAGGERALLEQVLARHRRSLFPPDGRVNLEAIRRVVDVQREAGALTQDIDLSRLVTDAIVNSL